MLRVALLRGVTPTGKNKIPRMSDLPDILSAAGLSQVRTYIQSGNIVFCAPLTDEQAGAVIHDRILEEIGADLSVIIKNYPQLRAAVQENPFTAGYDSSRVHMVFTNDIFDAEPLNRLLGTEFQGELLRAGSECLYLYLPRDAAQKRLNTNYLERQLGITATMRKLSVTAHLCGMLSGEG